ncbi:cytochrome P450 family protein [Rhizodiscina lignyota]|uniref:Cytochrome P450 family protein n=1 Tax=Rhizodiscina lignyota TaxID=1504668 RepID=A0A9P4I5G4_9PEZI|nr:cytochrome P450 family protein [Rhizodiscina lignyota]
MLSILSIVALALVAWAVHYAVTSALHARRARQWGCRAPPFKGHNWFLGVDNVLAMDKADKACQLPQFLYDEHVEMGCSTFAEGFIGDVFITYEPKNIQAILATQFQDFEIGQRRRGALLPLLGDGIFTTDGQMWEHSRSLLRPQFARDQIADLTLEQRHVEDMFKCFNMVDGWTSLDLAPVFFRFTMDSATEFLFGQSTHTQAAYAASSRGEKNVGEFQWADIGTRFDRGTYAIGVRARMADVYWLYYPKSFREDIREIHRFADACIADGMNRAKTSAPEKTAERYVFLDELLKATNDPVEIRSQLLNILLAGRDTTAGLLGWTFWNLTRHPDVYQKLRTAIVEEFGTYDSSKAITFTQLKACSYLQYVMMETLRLFPSVPANARLATRNTTLPYGGGPDGSSPVYVKKGQEVTYSVYVMHRRREIWGSNADEFVPERWIGRKLGWEYLPFNGGPRVCLGQQFALTEAGYVITKILQRFDKIEKTDPSDVQWHNYNTTSAPKRVLVRMHQAS